MEARSGEEARQTAPRAKSVTRSSRLGAGCTLGCGAPGEEVPGLGSSTHPVFGVPLARNRAAARHLQTVRSHLLHPSVTRPFAVLLIMASLCPTTKLHPF